MKFARESRPPSPSRTAIIHFNAPAREGAFALPLSPGVVSVRALGYIWGEEGGFLVGAQEENNFGDGRTRGDGLEE